MNEEAVVIDSAARAAFFERMRQVSARATMAPQEADRLAEEAIPSSPQRRH